jgi:hypothetical protein
MNYNYKITWVQPYHGWLEWQLQEIEKQLSYGNFAEAKLVIAKVMAL